MWNYLTNMRLMLSQFSTKIEVMVSEENAEPILVENSSGGCKK